jgi:hypothetical protein
MSLPSCRHQTVINREMRPDHRFRKNGLALDFVRASRPGTQGQPHSSKR